MLTLRYNRRSSGFSLSEWPSAMNAEAEFAYADADADADADERTVLATLDESEATVEAIATGADADGASADFSASTGRRCRRSKPSSSTEIDDVFAALLGELHAEYRRFSRMVADGATCARRRARLR